MWGLVMLRLLRGEVSEWLWGNVLGQFGHIVLTDATRQKPSILLLGFECQLLPLPNQHHINHIMLFPPTLNPLYQRPHLPNRTLTHPPQRLLT